MNKAGFPVEVPSNWAKPCPATVNAPNPSEQHPMRTNTPARGRAALTMATVSSCAPMAERSGDTAGAIQVEKQTRVSTVVEGQIENQTRVSTVVEGQVETPTRVSTVMDGQVENPTRVSTVVEGQVENPTCVSTVMEGQV